MTYYTLYLINIQKFLTKLKDKQETKANCWGHKKQGKAEKLYSVGS